MMYGFFLFKLLCVFFFYFVMKVYGYNSYEDILWNRLWNIYVGMSIIVVCIN